MSEAVARRVFRLSTTVIYTETRHDVDGLQLFDANQLGCARCARCVVVVVLLQQVTLLLTPLLLDLLVCSTPSCASLVSRCASCWNSYDCCCSPPWDVDSMRGLMVMRCLIAYLLAVACMQLYAVPRVYVHAVCSAYSCTIYLALSTVTSNLTYLSDHSN